MAIELGLHKLPWYGQIGLCVALSLAAVALFWQWHASPAQVDLDARRAQVSALRAEVGRGRAAAARLPEFRRQVAELERQLDALRAVLPEEQDVAGLLRGVQDLATQSRLTIRGFTPRAAARHDVHMEWPIGLRLEGRYHDLGAFLSRVSQLSRLITVGEITIRAIDPPSASATLIADCTATTFVLLDATDEAPAAPVAPGQGAE